MSIETIIDIQYTPSLENGTLVREINNRWRSINRSMVEIDRRLQILTALATTANFEVSYANNTDIDVFSVSALEIYITSIALRAPVTTMDVTCGILHASGVPAGFDPIILNPPLDPIPVTATTTRYTPLSQLAGGNALMEANDVFQVQTSNGNQGDPLYLTISFDIIGLSEDPAAAALSYAEAVIPL